MENIRRQRWLVIVFFVALSALFVWFAIFLAIGRKDPIYHHWMHNHDVQTYENWPQRLGEIVLLKDQQQVAGTLKLTYRGKAAGAIFLDVILLQMDATYTYHRHIPVKEAREGFWLSGSRFRLLSVNYGRLRIQRISTAP